MSTTYPCPCCGHLVFPEPPGSFDICPICFWEDDIVQLGYPMTGGGANYLSLHDSQQEFLRTGACEERFTQHVAPAADAPRDPEWRPFDPRRDPHLRWQSPADEQRWRQADFGNNVCLYYWRDDYWLAPHGGTARP